MRENLLHLERFGLIATGDSIATKGGSAFFSVRKGPLERKLNK